MSMTRDKIIAAQAEAARFIKVGNEALSRLNAEAQHRDDFYNTREKQGYDGPRPAEGSSPYDYSYGSKETGALRRASLDLTRCLAELRK
jgi:hypothetical protein